MVEIPSGYTFSFNGLLGSMVCTCTRCGCTINPYPDTTKLHDSFHQMLDLLNMWRP